MGDALAKRQDEPDEPPAGLVFEEIYDRYFPRIYNYIWYRVRDRDLADDLVADVFEKVYRSLSRYDPDKAPLSAWICAIARNTVRDCWRARRHPAPVPLDSVAERTSRFAGPEELVILDDSLELVRKAVGRLGKRENEIVAMKFGAGLSNAEIGRLCGMRENTVAVALHRAVRKLRKELLGAEEES